jgi:hypothetical protein
MTIHSPPDPAEIVVPLHVEDVAVERRKLERGVRVRVDTIDHDQLIDEALVRERVEIERVAIGRPVDTDRAAPRDRNVARAASGRRKG